ncbi:hypothetical protein [Niastella sp. OAS944]|uniref:hypothetical protein n=1 Tax=Niastella sp. OAS944 TaxID=2664089 RepID=UPI00346CBBEB|nr:hypothetical protein [Chitinophagaceae bacterium OAS944]
MANKFNRETYKTNLAKRELRRQQYPEPDTLLQDIRIYFTYSIPNTYFYLFTFTQVILRILQKNEFKCPGYSHIYISIGETKEEAIARAYELEDWYRFGIAVMTKEELLNASGDELEALMLEKINNGLKDIAALDSLDVTKIDKAIHHAREWGIFHERIIREKENENYCFRIVAKPIKQKVEEEIYFTLIDRITHNIYIWKFGELALLDTLGWLQKITVTNNIIRTKPAANMQLVLKGKKNELELSIEKIIDGSGRITLEDTIVPVEQWLIDLEKKIQYGSN